ncbi:ankyrin repeat domain-containing protein [Orientia tsutsugamushi]
MVARYQRTDVIQLLIDYGADIDVKNCMAPIDHANEKAVIQMYSLF